jgi:GT2 family glycosyltransferase
MIHYNIDEITLKNKQYFIRGWAFAQEEVLTIQTKPSVLVKKTERPDINTHFNIKGKDLGFEIVLPLHIFKTKIIFASLQEKKIENINLLKILYQYIQKKITSLINKKNIQRTINYYKRNGFKATLLKIKINFKPRQNYHIWFLTQHLPNKAILDEQKKTIFDYQPLISVVTPTFNTPKQFLIQMIESVLAQTYSNWELCIADGASTNPDTLYTLKKYAEKDKRIKVKFLTENYHISGNSNEAIKMSSGEYIGLFDHDDLLTPNALFENVKVMNEKDKPDFIYSDEDKTDEETSKFLDPHFKPDYSPDTLRSYNYIAHFAVFRKTLLEQIGMLRSECNGSQDHDLFLRIVEKTDKIEHIPKILYHWRIHPHSTAGGSGVKTYTMDASIKALNDSFERLKMKAQASNGFFANSYKTDYEIIGNPKISILIPNKDEKETLERCITSILKKSTYLNFEIIIIENNSASQEIFEYYTILKKNPAIQIIHYKGDFNYAAINNFGRKFATGEYLLLLNNDTEVISKNWLEEMLMHAQRQEIGAVGAKLYYFDDTIQHAGIILGIGSVAGHAHLGIDKKQEGYFKRACLVQNLSAVTAACLMVKTTIFDEVAGLDEKFKVAFNDVDFCLRIRQKGYLVLFTPYAELYHYESKSRGYEDTPEKIARFQSEIKLFEERWGLWQDDPYYNPNFTKQNANFELK